MNASQIKSMIVMMLENAERDAGNLDTSQMSTNEAVLAQRYADGYRDGIKAVINSIREYEMDEY